MIDNIRDGDLIIAPNHIKKFILKEISINKRIIDVKFLTIDELKQKLFVSYDERTIYYFMKKYNFKYSVAKNYLDNIFFDYGKLRQYYNYLLDNNLLYFESLKYPRILIVGYYNIDPYILDKLKDAELEYLNLPSNEYTHEVYEFNSQTDEIVFLASKIREDLKKINIRDMYLVVQNEEYYSELERIFDFYKIPINKKENDSIYSFKTTEDFIKYLKEYRDLDKALDSIKQNKIYNQIIDILNKYAFINEIDDTFIEILENEFKNSRVKKEKFDNAINIIGFDEIYDKNKYYYILGLNQNVIPNIYSDNDILSDKVKKKLGIITSVEKNMVEKNKTLEVLSTFPNLYLSYKLRDNYSSYYPSQVISDLNLCVKKGLKPLYIYSDIFNKLLLSTFLDDFVNYNEKNELIYRLYPNYESLDYKTYNNDFVQTSVLKYLNNKLTLSYSSMNNFFLCPFKYYVENILRLKTYEETFPIIVGNLFHSCLQNIYNEKYDLDEIFTDYIKKKELSDKELFFINKLYNILKQDIEVIKMQDSISSFNKKITEEKLIIEKEGKLKVNFVGIVDKISMLDDYVIITDYKTGSVNTKLDNIDDGLNLQLPVYIYLVKKGFKNNSKIVGFYLQKLINSYSIDKVENIYNDLKLFGYTINDENIISKIDSSYEDSKLINGMKKGKNGFYSYTKLISEKNIDKITNIVDKNIDKVIKTVEKGDFRINPKRMNNKLISCEYCKFKDLCFYKEEDITNLKIKKLEEIVGDGDA